MYFPINNKMHTMFTPIVILDKTSLELKIYVIRMNKKNYNFRFFNKKASKSA